MDISFGDQKVRINVFNSSKYVQKEENYFDSLDLMKDDFLDEPIEEIQVQKMKVLLDSPHPLSWSVRIEPLSKLKTESVHPSIQAPP